MDRARKIIALSLAAVFLVTLTVFAARVGGKVRFNGRTGSIWFTETADRAYTRTAYMLNNKNKVVIRWKSSYPQKRYNSKMGPINYYSYRVNMGNLPAGKYTMLTERDSKDGYWGSPETIWVKFNYAGTTFLRYHSTKVIRNNNGDLMQRLYFKRNNARGKGLHFQIFNNKNQLLRTYNFKSGNSNQWFCFDWNGWAGKNSARRSPRGVYTVKYWVDGSSPRTAKFRLAL